MDAQERKLLEASIVDRIENPGDPQENAKMVKFARKATNEVFKAEDIRVNAFLIASVRQKIKLAQNMMEGLEKLQERLFSDRFIQAVDIDQAISMFSTLVDKVLELCASIENTKTMISEINTTTASAAWSEIKQSKELSDSFRSSPQFRRRIQAAIQIIRATVDTIGDEKEVPVIDVVSKDEVGPSNKT